MEVSIQIKDIFDRPKTRNITIIGNYNPGEPARFYERNGDPGHPGEPESFEVEKVFFEGSDISSFIDEIDDSKINLWDRISKMALKEIKGHG